MLNRVVMVGRIASEIKLRYSNQGKAWATFRLAVDRPQRNENGDKQTDFFNILAFGRTAEVISEHMDKGRLIGIDGRLQVHQWEQDGQKRSQVEVVVETVQFLDRPKKQADAAADGGEFGDEWDEGEDEVPF